MKKLLLITLVVIGGLVALDATARSRSCGAPCNVKPTCAKPCAKRCVADVEVRDLRDLTPPCCEKFVRVEEPAICHEIITKECSWSCPTTCNRVDGLQSQFHEQLVQQHANETTRIQETNAINAL